MIEKVNAGPSLHHWRESGELPHDPKVWKSTGIKRRSKRPGRRSAVQGGWLLQEQQCPQGYQSRPSQKAAGLSTALVGASGSITALPTASNLVNKDDLPAGAFICLLKSVTDLQHRVQQTSLNKPSEPAILKKGTPASPQQLPSNEGLTSTWRASTSKAPRGQRAPQSLCTYQRVLRKLTISLHRLFSSDQLMSLNVMPVSSLLLALERPRLPPHLPKLPPVLA